MSEEIGPTNGDNKYKSVQHKLLKLAGALDSAHVRLQRLQMRMDINANKSEDLARDIERAELDKKFVNMQNVVSVALGGVAIEARKLAETTQEVAADAWDVRKTHAQLYEPLDTIRSGRAERTPKPGFLVRRGG
ncbi:conjugal transfer protein TraB [Streptomyces sp. N35]|uniref:conjugal transfer protein TraB n=1 Tax=Streptomyces sp. N35 TaxID=2795730 RepID=UPI0018F3FFB9|nr:conjugal transfer protein TraB [Streptomyces sp. N35]